MSPREHHRLPPGDRPRPRRSPRRRRAVHRRHAPPVPPVQERGLQPAGPLPAGRAKDAPDRPEADQERGLQPAGPSAPVPGRGHRPVHPLLPALPEPWAPTPHLPQPRPRPPALPDEDQAPPTVPGHAGLITALLEGARRHFAAAHYAVAQAFLRLIPTPGEHPARTWQRLGQLHFSLAEYEAAGRAYGNAAAFNPRDAALQVRLGLVCLRLDDLSGFESYLNRALALNPDDPDALQVLADLNRDLGRYPDAVHNYERLLAADPHHTTNRLALALCHALSGYSDAALRCLWQVGQDAPLPPNRAAD